MRTTFIPKDMVRVGPEIALPSTWTAEEELQGYKVTMTLTATRPPDGIDVGTVTCSKLEVAQLPDGPPVTLAGIRSIPVAKMTRIAVVTVLADIEKVGEKTFKISPMTIPSDLGKHGPTDETLAWVAKLYRIAQIIGDPPTLSVRTEFGISQATASRWVAAARAKGLLRPAA